MANLSFSINLSKLKNAEVIEMPRSGGKVQKCIVIPVEDALIREHNNNYFLNLVANPTPNNQWGNSHAIKQQIPRDVYNTLSEGERKNLPFLGNVKTITYQREQINTQERYSQQNTQMSRYGGINEDDLPF